MQSDLRRIKNNQSIDQLIHSSKPRIFPDPTELTELQLQKQRLFPKQHNLQEMEDAIMKQRIQLLCDQGSMSRFVSPQIIKNFNKQLLQKKEAQKLESIHILSLDDSTPGVLSANEKQIEVEIHISDRSPLEGLQDIEEFGPQETFMPKIESQDMSFLALDQVQAAISAKEQETKRSAFQAYFEKFTVWDEEQDEVEAFKANRNSLSKVRKPPARLISKLVSKSQKDGIKPN